MSDLISRDGVVVTGMGLVTPIGETVEKFWSSLVEGKSGIGPLTGVQAENLGISVAAQIKDFDPRIPLKTWHRDKTILHSDRYSWLAAAAADQAIKQSRIELPLAKPYRSACIIGSAAGGQMSGEKGCRDRFIDNKRAVHPMFLLRTIASSATAHIGIEYGVKGPTYAICSAGASAAHSISIGRDYIRHGLVDIAIVGGTESILTYGAMLAAQALGLLSREGCYPFSANRSGTVLAEGAGILVLESERHARARGAEILAEICGIGLSSNATDMLTPSSTGMKDAMQAAIRDARLAPTDIDYLNAHGSATRSSDLAETLAIKELFEDHAYAVGVSSTKSMHGHSFGAAAAVESIACIKALESGCMPPTIGLNDHDPGCDLDYVPNTSRAKKLRYVMSNTFALGGLNASLVMGKPPQ